MRSRWRVLAASGATLVAGSSLAQFPCTPHWTPFDPTSSALRGVSGIAYSSTSWDPDGAGPEQARLVVGGNFTLAGDVLVNNIATYDPATRRWSPLGSGLQPSFSTGTVFSLAASSDGSLYAGGIFSIGGGTPAANIARWDGTSWSSLGAGINSAVRSIAVLDNGDILAGGLFTTIGGSPANRIARWNGVAWSPLGSGMNGQVMAVSQIPNGFIVAGGLFSTAGGVAASNIALWNGTGWISMGGGTNGLISTLTLLPVGDRTDLVAGGSFTVAGDVLANRVARWNGASWMAFGNGVNNSVSALAVLADGSLIAGGAMTGSISGVAAWDGQAWTQLGGGVREVTGANGTVLTMCTLPGGALYSGGDFATAGQEVTDHVAHWDGSVWSALNDGIGGGNWPTVDELLVLDNGDLIAGGDFLAIGTERCNHVSRWNGLAWSPISTGLAQTGAPQNIVRALAELPDGSIVAGGTFTIAGGTSVGRVARWNGSTWLSMGSVGVISLNTAGPIVEDLYVTPNGDLIMSGNFTSVAGVAASRIARWDGSVWSPLGAGLDVVFPPPWPSVYSIARMPNGDTIAGGRFELSGSLSLSNLAQWSGTQWSRLGDPSYNQPVFALRTTSTGDLLVGGVFQSIGGIDVNRIGRWDGVVWHALGSGVTGINAVVYDITELPNGDIAVGGIFTNASGVPVNNIAIWNGTTWSALDGGVSGGVSPYVRSIVVLPNGDIAVGGRFLTAGGVVSPYLARWRSPRGCCDSIDFNNDTSLFDPQDIEAFLSVYSEGPCVPSFATCNDIDFNNDTSLFDPCDISSFLVMYSEGPCTPCGV